MLPVLGDSLGRSLIGRSMILLLATSLGKEEGTGRDIPGPKDIENTSEKMNILAIPAIPVDVFE
jgi:hypothetical protein